MGLMDGKKCLIMAVANQRSIAWGIAQALHREGAQLAFTYAMDRLKDNVVKLMSTLDGHESMTLLECDVQNSAQVEQVFRDYFASVDQPVVDYQFSGRSDYQAFINNGVAAGGLSTGSNGLKLESEAALFGGQAGVSYDDNYHSPADDISNVALDALDIQSDAIAHAVVQLGHDTSAVEPAAAKSRAGIRLRRVPVTDLGEVR